ncbi:hypothetical protein EHS25_001033 [Saitozyma podzolica]|uniref:N-acetyltransferase domain-containing protein n=1 Tax=Saitozyma podzolica TaxID=1890683 RepID=A0A427YH65_9TREE|nr:hypothetical protein EHS25_001033 [Saitozyma podzolica]
MSAAEYTVSTWDPSSSSEDIRSLWSKALPSLEPAYAIPAEKLHSLLVAPSARVFVAASPSTPTLGFALTYTIRSGSATMPSGQHLKGGLSMLIVDPSHRNRGIGSALHDAALSYLTKAVRDSLTRSDPPAKEGSIILGSVFPRIFPGVPDGPEFEPARQWFEKRGWAFGKDKSIDLYRTIVPGDQLNREMEPLLQRATDHGMRFGAPLASDDAALYALQKKEFDGFTGWPDMFPALIDSGHRDDIHCAFDPQGNVVGATIAALYRSGSGEPRNAAHAALAWPETLGKACGIIACVGVASSTRGSGAGIGMVASAVLDLARRGADGCFIDWVHLDGFYQKCGFVPWERPYWEAQRSVTVG